MDFRLYMLWLCKELCINHSLHISELYTISLLSVYTCFLGGISINQYLMIPIKLVYLSIIHKIHKLQHIISQK